MKKILLTTIVVLGIIGVLLSLFLTITHYTGAGRACPVGEHGIPLCDLVNQSSYSEVFGVPIALVAIFVFAFYSIASWLVLKNKWEYKDAVWSMTLVSGFAVGVAIYLIYVIVTVLQASCIYCYAAHSLSLLIFLLSLVLLRLS